jgi:protein-disulfide isomerase
MSKRLLTVLFSISSALAPVAMAEPWLSVNGKVYQADELPAALRSEVFDRRQEAHEAIKRSLEEYAVRLALAQQKNKNVKPESLPPLDELLVVPKPSDAEMRKLFEENKAQLPPGTTYEQVKDQIAQHMAQEARVKALEAKVAELQKAGKLQVLIAAPEAPQIALDVTGFPAKGPGNATVTLVEAADYLCPHCQFEQPEVAALQKELAGRVRFVYVPLALRPQGLSGDFARGAVCAQKQSDEIFWRYHEAAFDTAAKERLSLQLPSDPAKVKKAAETAKLDLKAWDACMASAESKQQVERTVARMDAVGVTSTPTFFLNGRKLHIDDVPLRQSVEAELAKTKASH